MPGAGNDGGIPPSFSGRIITPGTDHQLGTHGLFPPSDAQQRVLTGISTALTAKNADPDLLWISFAELCSGQASAADYRVLAARHSTWVIDGVPAPSASPGQAQAWLRFAEAIDALQERGSTLFLIGRRSLDWAGAAAALSDAQDAAEKELHSALTQIALQLSVLVRVDSAAELPPEETAGT